jgi:Leucine-rich repeat (LRR) protein
LTQLTISGFKCISSIEPNAFQHLPNLRKLCLVNNSIERIEFGFSGHLNKLTQLDLSVNQLCSIPKRSVSNLPLSLVNLNLSSNTIVDIECGAFDDLENLRLLNLAFNSFKELNLNNILNRDTVNLMFLNLSGDRKMSIVWYDSSQQEVNIKCEQQGILNTPSKGLRNQVVVYVISYQVVCREILNKLVDKSLITMCITTS